MTGLIVATNYRLLLLRDGAVDVIDEADALRDAHYYGVTWDPWGRLYVACEVSGEWRIKAFRPDGLLPPHENLSELHQIEWRDRELRVCSSGTNRMCFWDGWQWRERGRNMVMYDEDHINSIWGPWALEFRQKGGAPSALVHWPSGTEEIVGPCAHNIYIEHGHFHTLVSGEDAGILRISSTGRREVRPLGQRTFLRGLARTKDRWYIGNMLWENNRTKRESYRGDAQILVLNNDFDIIDEIVVPDCGAVAEVRALVGDRAHNDIDLEWQ